MHPLISRRGGNAVVSDEATDPSDVPRLDAQRVSLPLALVLSVFFAGWGLVTQTGTGEAKSPTGDVKTADVKTGEVKATEVTAKEDRATEATSKEGTAKEATAKEDAAADQRMPAAKTSGTKAGRRVDFRREIRPILSDACFTCHGPDEKKRRVDLRLDTREGAFEDLGGYAAVVPGKSEKSRIYGRITAEDPRDRMPPQKTGKTLSPEKVELLRRWIEEGAEWKEHWSYEPPVRPAVPDAGSEFPGFPRNTVDRFVAAHLAEEGLRPSPEADRVTLIRRLSFDLIGLPPSPAEVDSFADDAAPDAYERLVERLLASPHYGERMAIYWLDLVRYADTTGYHGDNHRDIWAYRDYVIRAFNQNEPFDRFAKEQLAGDLMEGSTVEQKVASGYNRLNMTTQEGGAQAGEYVAKYAADRVRNASSVFLGATMGCAECHDHKYDPYTQKDFYRFSAFFADLKELVIGEPAPGLPLPTQEQTVELDRLERRLAELKGKLDASTPDLAPLRDEVQALEKEKQERLAQVATTMISTSVEPRTVRVLPRGNWMDESGEVVQPGIPRFLRQIKKEGRATRLDLAEWLLERDHPLTARVFVNRLWKLFFGQGLAKSVDDLGSQGEAPTQPELLDWLAVELVERGWNVKAMVRLMVLSGTYRQSSRASRDILELDPSNRHLARQSRWRIDAEMVRDAALKVAGLLSPAIGGPSVKPPQPPGYWTHLNFPKRDYAQDHGESMYRRGLYTYWQRTFLYPSFLAFDAPSREDCCAERPRSNTPLQSLVLLNDPVYVEAARAFAGRIVKEGGSNAGERIAWAWREALSRAPAAAEAARLAELYEKHLGEYAADRQAAERIVAVGECPRPIEVDSAELAAWTSVARVILSLQETVTRN